MRVSLQKMKWGLLECTNRENARVCKPWERPNYGQNAFDPTVLQQVAGMRQSKVANVLS